MNSSTARRDSEEVGAADVGSLAHAAAQRFRAHSESEPQDWERLKRHLERYGMRLELEPGPAQFATGFANLNYLIQLDGGPAVLRRPPPGPLPPGAYDMGRESKILSRLWEALPLAPRALHYCSDDSVLGAPFQITEYREGISIKDTLPPEHASDPTVGHRLSCMLLDVLTDLHAVDPAAVGLDDLGRPHGFLQRTVEGWIKRAGLAVEGNQVPEMRKLVSEVGTSLRQWCAKVPDGAMNLLHNDFKLDNILLAPQSLNPVAIVDWDQGTRGDGLFDLASLLCYWIQADDPVELRELRQMPSLLPGFGTREEAADIYAQRTGRDLADFRFHRVLATFKVGIIFEQLNKRWRTGGTRNPRYEQFGPLARDLVRFAHEIAQGRAF